ncbi:MAG: hypothetical protein AMXMBFR53_41180 [Gemmatimonadota bacterium]
MNDSYESSPQEGHPWLLVLPVIPAKPDYFRVKVRRRLDQIGAVAVKQAAYVLPADDEAVEDLRWLRGEVVADGGEIIVARVRFLDGVEDADLVEEFVSAGRLGPGAVVDAAVRTPPPPVGSTWVTRAGVKVDRTASAWLIRRFIDPEARFRYVDPDGYRPAPGHVRFDMFDGEYTHEADRCTFEVLLDRFGLDDPALRALSAIVHDLDCKDGRFGRPETEGVGAVVDGIVRALAGDEDRMAAAAPVWEGLYLRLRASR